MGNGKLDFTLKIYDVLGREVFYKKVESNSDKIKINISGQPAGSYHLSMITHNAVFNRRIVIQ